MPSEVESPPKESPIAAPGCSTVRRWFELCVLLLISFGASLLNSVYFYRHGRTIFHIRQDELWGFGIIQEVVSLALLWYVLSRRKAGLKDLGLRWSIRDLLSGPVIAIVSYGAYWGTYHLLLAIHSAFLASSRFTPEPSASYGSLSPLYILLMLLNPFFEELIVRAYLMTEVHALTGSWILAAGLSTLLQTSYHIYYGLPVMTSLALGFLVFSIYYARKQRATPLIVAHGIFDIQGVLLCLI